MGSCVFDLFVRMGETKKKKRAGKEGGFESGACDMEIFTMNGGVSRTLFVLR